MPPPPPPYWIFHFLKDQEIEVVRRRCSAAIAMAFFIFHCDTSSVGILSNLLLLFPSLSTGGGSVPLLNILHPGNSILALHGIVAPSAVIIVGSFQSSTNTFRLTRVGFSWNNWDHAIVTKWGRVFSSFDTQRNADGLNTRLTLFFHKLVWVPTLFLEYLV